MITRLALAGDIEGILALQSANLYANLSPPDRDNGFVTTPFTVAQLDALLAKSGLFVAASAERIVGYTMAADWGYFEQWPIFPFMVARFSGRKFAGVTLSDENTFQYGPVCIDAGLRGTNAFPRLFEEMRLEFALQYPVGITFINRINERSYRAHTRKSGMIVIDEFDFSGQGYYSLAFDTARSVLQQP